MDLPHKVSRTELIAKLNEKKSKAACAYCGSNNWAFLDDAAVIAQWTNHLPAPGVPVAVMICNNCGNVRMHALGPLGLLPKEAKEGQSDG